MTYLSFRLNFSRLNWSLSNNFWSFLVHWNAFDFKSWKMRWVKMEMAEGEVGVCPSSLSSALFSRKREAHFFFLLTSQFYSKEIRKYFSDAGFVRIWVRVRIKPEKKILIRPNLGPICPSNIRHKRNKYSRETFWSLIFEWAILSKSFNDFSLEIRLKLEHFSIS